MNILILIHFINTETLNFHLSYNINVGKMKQVK